MRPHEQGGQLPATLSEAAVEVGRVISSMRREECLVVKKASSGKMSGLSTRVSSTFAISSRAPFTGQMY